MKRSRWLAITGGAALTILLLVVLMQWWPALTRAETLTEQEARESVISRYSGEIIEIRHEREKYIVDLRLDTGLYEIQIHAQSGDVLSLERKEAFTPPEGEGVQEPPPGGTPDPASSEPPLLLTEEEAAQLALQHIPGEVDDVDWKQIDGTGFYLVEIDLDDGREAIVQIHAITGEVMSVTWDD